MSSKKGYIQAKLVEIFEELEESGRDFASEVLETLDVFTRRSQKDTDTTKSLLESVESEQNSTFCSHSMQRVERDIDILDKIDTAPPQRDGPDFGGEGDPEREKRTTISH